MTSSIIFLSDSELTYSFSSSFPVLWLAGLFPFLCLIGYLGLRRLLVRVKAWSPFTPLGWLRTCGVSGTGMQVWVRTTMLWSSWGRITTHWGPSASRPGPCLRTICSRPVLLHWDSMSWGPRSSKTHGVRWMRPTVSWAQGSWGSDGFV